MDTIKSITIILFLLLGTVGCNKKVNNNEISIIGKWKLVKVTYPFTAQSYDYSQCNIIYEFDTNDILTVSGVNCINTIYRGHEIGEHFYSVNDDNKLTINYLTSSYTISSERLEISNAPLDGEVYNLNKIK